MGPFELAVEEGVVSETKTARDLVGDLIEAPKVSYWRTTDSGHKLGFSGSPGKGKVVAGNPYVTGHAKKGDGGGKKKSAHAFTSLPKSRKGKHADKARKSKAAASKRAKKKVNKGSTSWYKKGGSGRSPLRSK